MTEHYLLSESGVWQVTDQGVGDAPQGAGVYVNVILFDTQNKKEINKRVGFTYNVADRSDPLKMRKELPHWAYRAIMISGIDEKKEIFIRTTNFNQIKDSSVDRNLRDLTVAKLMLVFFSEFPSGILNTDYIHDSCLLSKQDITGAIGTINANSDVTECIDGQGISFMLKPGGKLKDLKQLINELSNKSDTESNVIAPIENRYFQLVSIGKYDSEEFIFVIMPFRDEQLSQAVWTDVIKPTLQDRYPGIHIIRSDDITDPGKVDNQLYTAIYKARSIIAEITVKNPNVYYELGLAHALNKKVFMVAQKKEGHIDLAFDITVARAEPYDNHKELKDILTEKLNL